MRLKPRVVYAMLFYTLAAALIYIAKPRCLFAPDGSIRRPGLNEGETLMSLGIVCIVAAIVSFYVFAVLDIIFE